MAVRIDPIPDATADLIAAILLEVLQGNRVTFRCPAGEQDALMARVRVGISRRRKKLERDGVNFRRFYLKQETYNETIDGKRFTNIVLWTSQSSYQQFAEIAQGIMNHG